MKEVLTQKPRSIFMKNGGILRAAEAIRLGIHPRDLYGMRDRGEVVELSRGLFRLASLPPPEDPDLLAVAVRVPRAVVCLTSALACHDLTTEVPHEVHIALPRPVSRPRLGHPPLRVFSFSKESFKAGIETRTTNGVPFRIYSPAKTIADCFKFRNRIGLDVALDALKRFLARKGASTRELLEYARVCRVEKVILRYLEALQ